MRVVAVDDLLERRVGVDVDVEPRAQELDAGVGDRLADEDAHRQSAAAYGGEAPRAPAPRARSTVAPSCDELHLDRAERGRDVDRSST